MTSDPRHPTPAAGLNISSLSDELLDDGDEYQLPAPFRAAEVAMRRMEARYISGEWTAEEYAAGLARIIVRSEEEEWTIGASSGSWYRRIPGGEWVVARPPSEA